MLRLNTLLVIAVLLTGCFGNVLREVRQVPFQKIGKPTLYMEVYALAKVSVKDRKGRDTGKFTKGAGELLKEGFGTIVVPYVSDGYWIKLTAQGEIGKLVVKSCHRESLSRPNPKSKRYLYKRVIGKKDSLKTEAVYIFKAISRRERKGCPVFMATIENQAEQRHGTSLFLISDRTTNAVNTELRCNASISKGNSGPSQYNGTGACAAKKGLKQEISFAQPMIFAPQGMSGCALPDKYYKESHSFVEFRMPYNLCVHTAINVNNRKVYRLHTIGYEVDYISNIEKAKGAK